MKKILVVMMMCLMSAVTFGKISHWLIKRGCRAHLMIIGASTNGWRPITVYHGYGATCAIAMQRARESAASANVEIPHSVDEELEPVVEEKVTSSFEVVGEN